MPTELRGSLRGYQISRHAHLRMKDRGFGNRDLEYFVNKGERREIDGEHIEFRIPGSPFAALSGDEARDRLAGSTLILDDARKVVVTVFWDYGLESSLPEGRPR